MHLIQPIHTNVAGRARFRIPGLRNTPSVKHFIERRLSHQSDILDVSASSVTGNLLVSYNSNNDHRSIQTIIEAIVQEYATDADKPVSPKKVPRTRSIDRLTGRNKPAPSHAEPQGRLPMPLEPEEASQWHLMDKHTVLGALGSSETIGLSMDAAEILLRQHGPNLLPESKPRSGLSIFWDQMNSLPVYLLGAAAGVSILTGGLFDAAVIMGVVVANAVIGYFTESAAEKTIHSLKRLVRPRAEVIRDGESVDLSIEAVVAGDILVLKPGTYVAADARIITATHLSIDESMLTGESLPAHKHARLLKRAALPLADRTNMAYMGTLVTGGQGLAVVVATGEATQIGLIQIMLDQTRPPGHPLNGSWARWVTNWS
jgi:Ca2+-transporting ATPase